MGPHSAHNDRTVTLSKKDDGLYMPRGLMVIVR